MSQLNQTTQTNYMTGNLMQTAHNITIVTPSRPDRAEFLAECVQSVQLQTVLPAEHLILIDHRYEGCYPTVNRLLSKVRTEFIQFLSDDNLLYSNHIATVREFTADNDLIYTYSDVTGRNINWNYPFSAEKLKRGNFINEPLIRMSSLMAASDKTCGGFDTTDCLGDWKLYMRMLENGSRFKCVPTKTFKFRYHADNYSTEHLNADANAVIVAVSEPKDPVWHVKQLKDRH